MGINLWSSSPSRAPDLQLWQKESRGCYNEPAPSPHWRPRCFSFSSGNFPLITLLTGWVQTALGTLGYTPAPKECPPPPPAPPQPRGGTSALPAKHLPLQDFFFSIWSWLQECRDPPPHPHPSSPQPHKWVWPMSFPRAKGDWWLKRPSEQLSQKKGAYKVRLFNLFTAAWPCHEEQITPKWCQSVGLAEGLPASSSSSIAHPGMGPALIRTKDPFLHSDGPYSSCEFWPPQK